MAIAKHRIPVISFGFLMLITGFQSFSTGFQSFPSGFQHFPAGFHCISLRFSWIFTDFHWFYCWFPPFSDFFLCFSVVSNWFRLFNDSQLFDLPLQSMNGQTLVGSYLKSAVPRVPLVPSPLFDSTTPKYSA